jgi:uncharacterized protein YhbP (UPF0306 family)
VAPTAKVEYLEIQVEQEVLHKRIKSLLRRHHLLSIATVSDGKPWCASCFYAWDEENNTLVITTDPVTRHGSQFRTNNNVAGTIALETKRIGRIRGIQFAGIISEPEGADLEKARSRYLRRFPYAALIEIHLWTIALNHIKLTDNRLGFGKKIIWEVGRSEGLRV